jgi:glycosyl transferase family 25
MVNYKIFVINLKRDKSKKDLFISNNKDILLDFEIIDAVDGKSLDLSSTGYDKDKAYRYLGREMTSGEVGCYLSHMEIYQRVVDEGLSHALILEDDVKIVDRDIHSLINEMVNKKYWDLLFLYKRGKNRFLLDGVPLGKVGKYKYHIGTRTVWGTPAYVVTNNAAKKLLKFKRDIFVPIDMLGRTWRDRFLNMYYLTPDIIEEDKSLSVLEADRSVLVKKSLRR